MSSPDGPGLRLLVRIPLWIHLAGGPVDLACPPARGARQAVSLAAWPGVRCIVDLLPRAGRSAVVLRSCAGDPLPEPLAGDLERVVRDLLHGQGRGALLQLRGLRLAPPPLPGLPLATALALGVLHAVNLLLAPPLPAARLVELASLLGAPCDQLPPSRQPAETMRRGGCQHLAWRQASWRYEPLWPAQRLAAAAGAAGRAPAPAQARAQACRPAPAPALYLAWPHALPEARPGGRSSGRPGPQGTMAAAAATRRQGRPGARGSAMPPAGFAVPPHRGTARLTAQLVRALRAADWQLARSALAGWARRSGAGAGPGASPAWLAGALSAAGDSPDLTAFAAGWNPSGRPGGALCLLASPAGARRFAVAHGLHLHRLRPAAGGLRLEVRRV